MKILATILLLLICTTSFADRITVPFDCYPKALQRCFEYRGYKLDLSGNDRTKDSWGFLVNKGTKFEIYTYEPISVEELEMIKEVTWEMKSE